MKDEAHDGRRLRVVHTQSYELKTGEMMVQDVGVDPTTNAIVFQNEQHTTRYGVESAECTFLPDRVESKRTLRDGEP